MTTQVYKRAEEIVLSTIYQNEVIFFFQAEDGIRYDLVTGVQTCALPISGSLMNQHKK
nr:hypothetical protein [Staphylococcus haemolyticus]